MENNNLDRNSMKADGPGGCNVSQRRNFTIAGIVLAIVGAIACLAYRLFIAR
jgi:hypothetical protein